MVGVSSRFAVFDADRIELKIMMALLRKTQVFCSAVVSSGFSNENPSRTPIVSTKPYVVVRNSTSSTDWHGSNDWDGPSF